MSDDREETADLAFIGRALARLTGDVATVREDMHVLTAIALRHDREFERLNGKLDDMIQQLRAMVSQHQRTADRVRQLEEQR